MSSSSSSSKKAADGTSSRSSKKKENLKMVIQEKMKEGLEDDLVDNLGYLLFAEDIVEVIFRVFGFRRRTIDNTLTTDERKLFYKLEDYGLLTSERETMRVPSGKIWNIDYWILNTQKIEQVATQTHNKEKKDSTPMGVYEDIPDKVWKQESKKGEKTPSSQ